MKKFIFYGAVHNERTIDLVKKMGGVMSWVDTNPEKQDTSRRIFAPAYIGEHPDAAIVILSDKIKEIATYIRDHGWQNEILVTPHFRYPYYDDQPEGYGKCWVEQHREELQKIYRADDAYTQKLLKEMEVQRAMDAYTFIPVERMLDFSHINLYFYDPALAPKGDFTLVNGGAYDGDSIEESWRAYGDRMKLAYAVEPDPDNIAAMKHRLAKLGIMDRVRIMPNGMSDEDKVLYFSESGTMKSHFESEGTIKIPVRKNDSIVDKVIGDLCINMDVEGSEVAAIRGSKRLIEEYHPYFAITIYHKWDDFVAVPQAIRGIRDDYDFYIRSGSHTECYAVPRA